MNDGLIAFPRSGMGLFQACGSEREGDLGPNDRKRRPQLMAGAMLRRSGIRKNSDCPREKRNSCEFRYTSDGPREKRNSCEFRYPFF